jgi:hypothetical protein
MLVLRRGNLKNGALSTKSMWVSQETCVERVTDYELVRR